MIVICDRCRKQSSTPYTKPDGQPVPSEANYWLCLFNARDKDKIYLCPNCEADFKRFIASAPAAK